ncbi:fimbrial protein [Escherichia coli]|uniref:F4 family fimbrial subunit n=1 Tax=Escherichia coli TaxID=562 RepID=UPI0038B3C77C
MKKTLIALVVATSAVTSYSAMAWQEGDFNGTVNIGGVITDDNYKAKWSWDIGSDLNSFSNKVSEMTDSGKKLTISVTENKSILLGKTTEASFAPSRGVGAAPNISFTDYKGVPVQLSETGTDGKVKLVLPMKNNTDQEIGNLTVNATAVGYMVAGTSALSTSLINSLYADNSFDALFGGVQMNSANAIQKGNAAASKVAALGGVTLNELMDQLKAKHANISGSVFDRNTVQATDWTNFASNKYPDAVAAAGYALGIESGEKIEANFNTAVNKTTEWKAPLNVQVSYQ